MTHILSFGIMILIFPTQRYQDFICRISHCSIWELKRKPGSSITYHQGWVNAGGKKKQETKTKKENFEIIIAILTPSVHKITWDTC